MWLQQLVDQPDVAGEWRIRDRRVLTAAPDAAERTARRKSTYPFRLSNQPHGHNPDSWKPFDCARRLFFVCGKHGRCGALVQAIKAYKAARAKGRAKLQPGDGCAAPCCVRGRHRNPSRFTTYQRATATSIVDGSYLLIRRPRVVRPKSVTLVKSEDVLKATRAVLRSSKASA